MTPQEFYNNTVGKAYDIDGSYGYQCLTKGSIVLKADGTYIPIENIKVGDMLHGGNAVVSNEPKRAEIYHVRTSLGHMNVSKDHRFITTQGEKVVTNLTTNDCIEIDTIANGNDLGLTKNELKFYGLWLADGTKKYRWQNSTKAEIFITIGTQAKEDYINSLNLDMTSSIHSNGKAKVYRLLKGKYPQLEKLIEGTNDKKPMDIFSQKEYAQIIEGYCMGDGSTKNDGIVCTSITKELLLFIQKGCFLNGWRAVLSKPYIRKETNLCKNPKPIYHLTINKKHLPKANVLSVEKVDDDMVYVLNVGGNHTYYAENHHQHNCWDGMAKFCKDNAIPLSTIYCAKTGYVQDIWELRNSTGILKYFDEATPNNFKNGDWVIWGRDYNMTPKSHVAMYWNGKAYGQSQNGIKKFNLATLDFSKALGGFRWKNWSDETMTLKNGFQTVSYNNATLKIYKGYGDYKELRMLSALGGEKATQDIKKFDSNDLTIIALANCNYFEMSSKTEYGQHYGVEQSDGDNVHTSSLDLAPKNSAYQVVYCLNDGSVGKCTADNYWYAKSDVKWACTPYSIVVWDKAKCNERSSAFGNKETTANSQTMYMLVDGAWCIVCTASKVLPSVMQAFALECNADKAFLVDSGGSTQMMAYTSTWESIIYTGRHIPNVLALVKVKDTTDTPTDSGSDTPSTETVSKEEYDKLKAEYDSVCEEKKTLQNEVTVLENKITEIKKVLEG